MTRSTHGRRLLAALLLSAAAADAGAPGATVVGLRGLRSSASRRPSHPRRAGDGAAFDGREVRIPPAGPGVERTIDATADAPALAVCEPVLATLDSSLRAPGCFSVAKACLSGALLNGKSNNGEPNGDNTLDSCADGSDGTYRGDESINHISVSVVGEEGGLRSGSMALVEASVWAWKDGSADTADFYYAADARNPSWVFIGSRRPNKGGMNTLAVQYQLPSGALQAVRVNLRRRGQQGGDSGSCSGGKYDDVDDLVFAVSASDGSALAASPA